MSTAADRQPIAQFKRPHFFWVWKTANQPKAKWRLGLIGFHHRESPRRLHVTFCVRGLMAWSITGSVITYVAGAAAVAWMWGRSPYNSVTFSDLLLAPVQWQEIRAKRGSDLIKEGISEMRRQKYATGITLLSHGVGLAPGDMQGRLNLAKVFGMMGFLHRAQQTLADGLAYGVPPKAYREALFRLGIYLEDYIGVLTHAEHFEKSVPANDASTRRWLTGQRAVALEKLKRLDELEALRASTRASPIMAVEAAWARARVQQGNPAAALAEIRSDPSRFGLPEEHFPLQVQLAIAAKDVYLARQCIAEWRSADPAAAAPRIEEILALIRLQEGEVAKGRLEGYCLNFGADKPAMVQLFKKLGELPDSNWLRLAKREAEESGPLGIESRVAITQGLLSTGAVNEALAEFELARTAFSSTKTPDGGWVDGTQRVFGVILGDSPSSRSLLSDFFSRRSLTPEAFRFALLSLRRSGCFEAAAEIAVLARNRFPAFQDNLTPEIAALQAATKPRPKSVSVKPTPTTPRPVAVLAATARNIEEAKVLLKKATDSIQAASFEDALDHLRLIERGNFPELSADVKLARIRIHGIQREQAELTSAIQLYLASKSPNLSILNELAQSWNNPLLRESALTLSREVADKFPQARWASELRKKIEGDLEVAPGEALEIKPKR